MFKVIAVESKTEQERLCGICNTKYMPDAFAYAAYDLNETDSEIGDVIGVCQFSFMGGCVLHCLAPAEGKASDEAMLILGFSVLEFLRRCGFSTVFADISDTYANRLGFRIDGDKYSLDLTAPRSCGGH